MLKVFIYFINLVEIRFNGSIKESLLKINANESPNKKIKICQENVYFIQ